ncbi:hypothetical protein ACFFX1_53480 [Dactylosporangium sucinum]|uniref:Lipoprotein n=1 Tax=Dactylosporangium sucinum TaxID=1424081 RepID=A0A917UAY5_9ACTN|nr:hypothetical protein [Dactylosporangium sucinum]GGM72526.1 hypothetical protein GCM10007977_087740 [Dactylosporangium sucinum]
MSFLLWSGRAIGYRRAAAGATVALGCFVAGYLVVPERALEQPKWLLLSAVLFLAGLAVAGWAAAMGHVGVQISMYNVRIRHGLLPMPPISVPLRMIGELRSVDVQSSIGQRWGWTWVPGRGRAVIVRSGPALVFDFGGRQFMVSVDDPEDAIAALGRVRATAR